MLKKLFLTVVPILLLSDVVRAQTTSKFLDASASDPANLGWMKGAPPAADKIIRFEDGSYFKFPQMRWSVSNFRQLMPTVNISRGLRPSEEISLQENNKIDSLRFKPMGSEKEVSWSQSLKENYTDGIIIVHRGSIIYERYFGVLDQFGQHGAMSMTKSFVGTLAEILIAEKKLKAESLVTSYLPELKNSGFKNATVRDLMDMTTGIRFSEDYSDPNAEVWQHAKAGNPLPKEPGYKGPKNYYEFLQTIKPEGKNGAEFHYRTANTDALGWVLARVTGKNVAELISEKIWKPLRAEQDAYMSVDSIGTPFAGGGLNLGLRDLARFGELMRNQGQAKGVQVIPAQVLESIKKGGDRQKFTKAGYDHLKGWSYRSMWWITHNKNGAFMARGVHGQALYIDPVAEVVIARFSSYPIAANAANDPMTLPAFNAVAEFLSQNK